MVDSQFLIFPLSVTIFFSHFYGYHVGEKEQQDIQRIRFHYEEKHVNMSIIVEITLDEARPSGKCKKCKI